LDTLIEGEMNTVFTNDAKYLSARDDLLAVNLFIFRKLPHQIKILRNYLSKKLKKD
jgi:hypothetical protein